MMKHTLTKSLNTRLSLQKTQNKNSERKMTKMRRPGVNATIAVYMPLQQATDVVAIADAARRRPSQILAQAFIDQTVLLGLESGAHSWHDVDELTRDDWSRNLSKLIDRCVSVLKTCPLKVQTADTQL